MTSGQPVGIRPAVVATRPLTATQRALWTSQRLDPDAPLANMGDRFRIDGPLDPDQLIAAFAQVVAVSPALRTVIDADADGSPVARILARAPRTTELIDLPLDDLDDWSARRISTPIDATTCVYDSALLRHGDDRWTWWLDIHHVATDAATAALLFAATSEVYDGRAAGELIDTGGGLYDWADSVTGVSDPVEPTDQPTRTDGGRATPTEWSPYGRRGPRTTAVERIELPIDADVRRALDDRLADEYRSLSRELSLLALSITITAVLGHRFENRSSLTVGVPIHHRRTPDARRTVGPLMRLSPVTVEVDADATWREQFSDVLRSLLDVLRSASPDGEPGTDGRFDVVANVTTATYGRFAGLRTERRWMRSGHVEADHVVRHQLFDRADPDNPSIHQLDWELDLNTSLSADGTHRALPRHLARALAAAVADPDSHHRAV
ncbi:MAG: condensation domain-containing protein, partial [Actinomycetota bacterium]